MRSKKVVLLLVLMMVVALLSSGCIFSSLFNRRPVIETISDQIRKVGQEFIYQVIAYDPDNGELTYSLTEKPEDMQIESYTGLINWIPGEDQIGTFTVEVKVTDGSSFNIEKFEITIEDIFLTSIEVSPANISVSVENSNPITSVTAYYDNGDSIDLSLADCDYSSSNTNIATVDNNGLITGVSTGIAVITVTYTEGNITKNNTVTVTVENVYLTSITVLPSNMNMYVGSSKNITSITTHYNDGSSASIGLGSATYSSNNPGIASVNTTGWVTGVSAGGATITVSYTEGGAPKTATVGVTVLEIPKVLTSINVSPTTMQMLVGNSNTIISIIADYSNGDSAELDLADCDYDSDNNSIAIVNDSGVITGVSVGTATITVTYTDGGITETDTVGVTVTEIPKVLTSISVLSPSLAIKRGSFKNITSITAHYSDGSSVSIGLGSAIYNSDNINIATVNTTGKVTGISIGTATITVYYTDGITKNDTVSVTISGG